MRTLTHGYLTMGWGRVVFERIIYEKHYFFLELPSFTLLTHCYEYSSSKYTRECMFLIIGLPSYKLKVIIRAAELDVTSQAEKWWISRKSRGSFHSLGNSGRYSCSSHICRQRRRKGTIYHCKQSTWMYYETRPIQLLYYVLSNNEKMFVCVC